MQVFTGRMLFLSANQQHQSTDPQPEKISHWFILSLSTTGLPRERRCSQVKLFMCICCEMRKKCQPAIQRVQALADILRTAIYAFAVYKTISLHVCCDSNKTDAPIANLPNNAQLEGIPYHSPKLHPGLCSSVGMR